MQSCWECILQLLDEPVSQLKSAAEGLAGIRTGVSDVQHDCGMPVIDAHMDPVSCLLFNELIMGDTALVDHGCCYAVICHASCVVLTAGQEAELVSQGGPSTGAQPNQAPDAATSQQGQQADDDEPPPPEPVGTTAGLLASHAT